ncbi:MAG: hypothetical protein QXS66_03665 [Thermoproteota archaeon]
MAYGDFNEEEFNEFTKEVFDVLRQKLTETHRENPKVVTDIIDLHDVIHTVWSSSEKLEWFRPYCSILAYSLLSVLYFPEVGFFGIRHVLEAAWKRLSNRVGSFRRPDWVDSLFMKKDLVYGRLSEIVHAKASPPDSLDERARLCVDCVDVILAILAGYLSWELGRKDLVLALSEEDYELLKHSVEKLNMQFAKSMFSFAD